MTNEKETLTTEVKLLKRNQELLEQLHKTTLDLEGYVQMNEGLVKINGEKEETILALLEAMTFYSDKDNYHDYEEFGEPSTIDVDEGKRARKAIQISKDNA